MATFREQKQLRQVTHSVASSKEYKKYLSGFGEDSTEALTAEHLANTFISYFEIVPGAEESFIRDFDLSELKKYSVLPDYVVEIFHSVISTTKKAIEKDSQKLEAAVAAAKEAEILRIEEEVRKARDGKKVVVPTHDQMPHIIAKHEPMGGMVNCMGGMNSIVDGMFRKG